MEEESRSRTGAEPGAGRSDRRRLRKRPAALERGDGRRRAADGRGHSQAREGVDRVGSRSRPGHQGAALADGRGRAGDVAADGGSGSGAGPGGGVRAADGPIRAGSPLGAFEAGAAVVVWGPVACTAIRPTRCDQDNLLKIFFTQNRLRKGKETAPEIAQRKRTACAGPSGHARRSRDRSRGSVRLFRTGPA